MKLLTEFSGRIDSLEGILALKCPKFINLHELYYFKGIEALERNKSKENLYESLNNFKFLSSNLEEIIEKYLELDFFIGAITLLKKTKEEKKNEMNFNKKMLFLKKALKCKKSIEIGLSESNKEFTFLLFDALISNLLEKEELFYDPCLCCGISFSFNFNDLLNLNSVYIKEYLSEKSEISLLEEEYNLIWKYYTLKEETEKAISHIIWIAETKPMPLSKRLSYLNIAYTLKPSKDTFIKIETLKIQMEFIKVKEDCYLENKLLSSVELFNDFLIPNNQSFLALKLYDLFNYTDYDLLNKLWLNILKDDLKKDLSTIKGMKLSGSSLNLEVIVKILLEKYSYDENLVLSLVEIGFNKNDVLDYFEKLLKGSEYQHPNDKKKIMDILIKAGDVVYQKRVKGYCEGMYGIN